MQSVKLIIAEELEIFEKKFALSLKSQTPLLDSILKYVIRRKGKQLRPMFVFLSARIAGSVNESTYRAASLVELLHTATLVHDDVVDESAERRGFFSINALWKNKIAVLVGDYLLSKGLLLSTSNEDFMHLHILSDAVREMSEGELLQIEKSRRLNMSEDIYFEIIRKKTASLLASACAVGAFSATGSKEHADKMKLFGEKVGMAFQIKDDLLDYGKDNIGKPLKNDIKEKKLTLPIIFTLQHVDNTTRRKIIYILKNKNKDHIKIAFVINEVIASGGIKYAEEKMLSFRDEAIAILHTYESSPERNAMEQLVRFTTERKF
jgi:octaprenyl-diphosphate synthase